MAVRENLCCFEYHIQHGLRCRVFHSCANAQEVLAHSIQNSVYGFIVCNLPVGLRLTFRNHSDGGRLHESWRVWIWRKERDRSTIRANVAIRVPCLTLNVRQKAMVCEDKPTTRCGVLLIDRMTGERVRGCSRCTTFKPTGEMSVPLYKKRRIEKSAAFVEVYF